MVERLRRRAGIRGGGKKGGGGVRPEKVSKGGRKGGRSGGLVSWVFLPFLLWVVRITGTARGLDPKVHHVIQRHLN